MEKDRHPEELRICAAINAMHGKIRDALSPDADLSLKGKVPSMKMELKRLKFKLKALRDYDYTEDCDDSRSKEEEGEDEFP